MLNAIIAVHLIILLIDAIILYVLLTDPFLI